MCRAGPLVGRCVPVSGGKWTLGRSGRCLPDLDRDRTAHRQPQGPTSERRKDGDGKPTPLSAASINRPLALLRHLLRLACEEWEVLASVPKVKLEKEPEGRIKWLDPGEEQRLLTACEESDNGQLLPPEAQQAASLRAKW